MSKEFKHLFSGLEKQEVPLGLYDDIVFKLEKARIKKGRTGLLIQSILSITSLVAIFPVFMNVVERFSQSGFFQYLSLIFTDGEIVLSNWKIFVSSLLESAPFYEVTILLVAIFVLLESLKFAFRNFKMIQYRIYQPN
jgi:hypothetical protein